MKTFFRAERPASTRAQPETAIFLSTLHALSLPARWLTEVGRRLGSSSNERKPRAGRIASATIAILVTGEVLSGGFAAGAPEQPSGNVLAWGCYGYGQLGPSQPPKTTPPSTSEGECRITATSPATPTHHTIKISQGEALGGVLSLAAGGYHSLALTADGLWAWGRGIEGQLGNGGLSSSTQPVQVASSQKFVAVSAGLFHSVGLTSDGDVFTWGFNNCGQLGLPEKANEGRISTPQQVKFRSDDSIHGADVKISQIAAGYHHTLALDTTGTVWAWGESTHGQLGNGVSGVPDQNSGCELPPTSPATPLLRQDAPTRVPVFPEDPGEVEKPLRMTSIASGGRHSMALSEDGRVWAWGSNCYGQLGLRAESAEHVGLPRGLPLPVSSLPGNGMPGAVVAMAGGLEHSLALTESGEVWAWGRNDLLGQGPTVSRNDVTRAQDAVGKTTEGSVDWIGDVPGGLQKDHRPICPLAAAPAGNPDTSLNPAHVLAQPEPVRVPISGGPVVSVSAGERHSLAVTRDSVGMGILYAWGKNDRCELGVQTNPVCGPNTDLSQRPGRAPGPIRIPESSSVATIHTRHRHTLALLGSPESPPPPRRPKTWNTPLHGPLLSISDETVKEGPPGVNGEAIFAVTLADAQQSPVTVNYASVDGTASSSGTSADFQSVSGSLTFEPGQTTKLISVKTNGDDVPEPRESFFLELSNETNAVVIDSRGEGAIENDDGRGFSISDTTVAEGNSGDLDASEAVFTVAASEPAETTMRVDFATEDLSAKAASDYTAASGTLVFEPGETTKTISIRINGDDEPERNEQFQINLSNPVQALLVTPQAKGRILNDDGLTVSIRDAAPVGEREPESSRMAAFQVELSEASDEPLAVDYMTSDGSARRREDYAETRGALVFPAGQTSRRIEVPIIDNRIAELTQNFFVTLSDPSERDGLSALTDEFTGGPRFTIFDELGESTILDNDVQNLRIEGSRTTEGSSGATVAHVTVNADIPSEERIEVDYVSEDSTAKAGEDYEFAAGTTALEPMAKSKLLTLYLIGDQVPEEDESFLVRLTAARGAIVVGRDATIDIVDDDDHTAPVVARNFDPKLYRYQDGGRSSGGVFVSGHDSDDHAARNSAQVRTNAGNVDDSVSEAGADVPGGVAGQTPDPNNTLSQPSTPGDTVQDNRPEIDPQSGARRIIQRAIAYVTRGNSSPRILYVTSASTGSGPLGMAAAGYPKFDIASGKPVANRQDLRKVQFSQYDVIIVSCSNGCGLEQPDLDALNERSAEIMSYVNGGGGLVAFDQSNLQNQFRFLPFLKPSVDVLQSEKGFRVTAFGESLGLTDADVSSNISHNIFEEDNGLGIVDVDRDGRIVSLATRKRIGPQGAIEDSSSEGEAREGEDEDGEESLSGPLVDPQRAGTLPRNEQSTQLPPRDHPEATDSRVAGIRHDASSQVAPQNPAALGQQQGQTQAEFKIQPQLHTQKQSVGQVQPALMAEKQKEPEIQVAENRERSEAQQTGGTANRIWRATAVKDASPLIAVVSTISVAFSGLLLTLGLRPRNGSPHAAPAPVRTVSKPSGRNRRQNNARRTGRRR